MAVATPIDNVVVRLAKPSDYDEVVTIDTALYEGYDAVPGMFHRYLADPRRMVFVMEVDKKIVAFTMYYIVDDGKSAVAQAARIKPTMRSSGLYNHIGNQAFDMMWKQNPDVTRVVLVSSFKSMILGKIKSGTWKVDLVLERPFIDGQFTSGKQDVLKTLPVSPRVVKVDPVQEKSILLDPENQWKLFPQRRIVMSTEPYNASPSNVDIIVASNHECLCTFEDGPRSNRCSTISLGQALWTKVGMRYHIEIYSLDFQEGIEHMVRQLQLGLTHFKGGLMCFMVGLPRTFPRDQVTDWMKKHLPIDTNLLAHMGDSFTIFEQNLEIHSSLRSNVSKL